MIPWTRYGSDKSPNFQGILFLGILLANLTLCRCRIYGPVISLLLCWAAASPLSCVWYIYTAVYIYPISCDHISMSCSSTAVYHTYWLYRRLWNVNVECCRNLQHYDSSTEYSQYIIAVWKFLSKESERASGLCKQQCIARRPLLFRTAAAAAVVARPNQG